MTICDVNGNTVNTGKNARAWYRRHIGDIVSARKDSAGRGVVGFSTGHTAFYWPEDERAPTKRTD